MCGGKEQSAGRVLKPLFSPRTGEDEHISASHHQGAAVHRVVYKWLSCTMIRKRARLIMFMM